MPLYGLSTNHKRLVDSLILVAPLKPAPRLSPTEIQSVDRPNIVRLDRR